MGDQQGGAAVVGEVVLELGAGVESGTGVEGGERLVQQEQGRFDGEGTSQRHPLGLPAGEVPRFASGVFGEPDPGQPVRCPLSGPVPVEALAARPERDVVQGGQVREEQVVLEDDTDRPLLGRGPQATGGIVQVTAGDAEVPVGEGDQAGEGT
ncbi:hypothetical protein GCM10029963_14000 [Micromonospora andamanensis]